MDTVKASAHVEIPRGYERAVSVVEFLTSRSHREPRGVLRRRVVFDQQLTHVQLILVDHRPGAAGATERESALQLAKRTHMRSDVHIGVTHHTIQTVAIAIGWGGAPALVAVQLER